jgi:hypothetical protein
MSKSPLLGSTSALSASPHLLGAALAGLLCFAGCSQKDASEGSKGAAGETGQSGSGHAAAGDTSSSAAGHGGEAPTSGGSEAGGSAGSTGATEAGGAPEMTAGGAAGAMAAGAAGAAGAGGAAPEYPHITSSQNVGVMTEDQFKALCDERGGTVEIMPHCGGFATAKGFSYDSGTELLSEHTCQGANTCAGWNCAIPD